MANILTVLSELPEGSKSKAWLEGYIAQNKFSLKVSINLNDELEITNFNEVMQRHDVEIYGDEYHYHFTYKLPAHEAQHLSNKQIRKMIRSKMRVVMSDFKFKSKTQESHLANYFQSAVKDCIQSLRHSDRVQVGKRLWVRAEVLLRTKTMEFPLK
ncbi:hypothetical protein VCHA53O466_50424 [Vibrio chagasii]|nr:hypothetical protein VCHA53O466_50424 [Vibrio chagasii]